MDPFEWAGIIWTFKNCTTPSKYFFFKNERYAAAPALLLDLANQNASN
jgi:hypothetical protein